ncbi:MAG TPA: ribosome silencing factor [Luteolibacter sp.]|nr:ribosome silencing factor [Luteolibacter sp.]
MAATIQGKTLAIACARAADDVKAENIRILDLRGLSSLTDFMVICTGHSMPQMRAILRDVAKKVDEDLGVKPVHREGRADARWVVLDFIDVMVHVMDQGMRDHYGLEELWKDAPAVAWAA